MVASTRLLCFSLMVNPGWKTNIGSTYATVKTINSQEEVIIEDDFMICLLSFRFGSTLLVVTVAKDLQYTI